MGADRDASTVTQPKVLVVDDEQQMTQIVAFALETQGFAPVVRHTVADAWTALETHDIALVVLDVMLPDGSGVDLCRRIRSRWQVPVVLLTALGEVDHRVAGLEAGADDYVAKPFSPRELALRVQAIARRASPDGVDVVRVGMLALHPASSRATWRDRELDVPESELRLLLRLARDAGRFVAVPVLLRDVWHVTADAGGRDMVKSMVYRLRRQLRAVGAPDDLVDSARGRGYRLRIVARSDGDDG